MDGRGSLKICSGYYYISREIFSTQSDCHLVFMCYLDAIRPIAGMTIVQKVENT